MADLRLPLSVEGPEAVGPLQELLPGNIRFQGPACLLPRVLIENDNQLDRCDHKRRGGAYPRSPRGSPGNVPLIPDDRRMIPEPRLLCDRRKVRSDTLLPAFILVERNVEAEPPVGLYPGEAAGHPASGEFEILVICQLVIVRIIVDSHIIRGGGNHQIYRSGLNLFRR